MTVIVYRDGVIAADSGSWSGDATHRWSRKIARAPDGTLYGCAGSAAMTERFLQWAESGEGPMPEIQPGKDGDGASRLIALKITPDGVVSLLSAEGEGVMPGARYMAIGGGSTVAFGALFMGASAEQAVLASIEHSGAALGPVKTVSRLDAQIVDGPRWMKMEQEGSEIMAALEGMT